MNSVSMVAHGAVDMAAFTPPLPFVLCTHWGTFVCIDPSTGGLIHRAANECTINLALVDLGEKIYFCNHIGGAHIQPSVDHASFNSLEVLEDKQDGTITIREMGTFASAEPDGKITISRSAANGWEKFTRISLEAAYQRKIQTDIAVPRFRRQRSIPKIIHQIYLGNELPDILEQNTKNLRDLNPDYAYQLWTDKDAHDFIYDVYGYDILDLYLKIDRKYGACRADLFRYLCVYKLGGVYLDIKSGVDRRLSEIIRDDDEYLISQWDNGPGGKRQNFGTHSDLSDVPGGEYQQWHVIAAPGHPFLEKVIETVLRNIKNYNASRHGVGKIGALRSTGPFAYTMAINPIIGLHPHRVIKSESDGLLYSVVEDHTKLFSNHYASLKTPIVS